MGKAAVRQLERHLDDPRDEAVTGTREGEAPVERTELLERVPEATTSPARTPPGQIVSLSEHNNWPRVWRV